MPYARPEALVTTEWLAAHLDDPHVRVLDSSFKQPGITPTARQDYDSGHIPGAVFFDIDDVAEPGTTLPHMIPSAERFAEKMAERAHDVAGRDRWPRLNTDDLGCFSRCSHAGPRYHIDPRRSIRPRGARRALPGTRALL